MPERKKNSTRVQLLQALSGGISGATMRLVTQPLDVLKIRFQMQVEPVSHGEKSKYSSVLQAIKLIHKEEGWRGFMRGHVAGQVESINYALIQFWTYEQVLIYIKQLSVFHDRPLLTYFTAGGTAGSVGMLLTHPLDLVRTRMVASDPKSSVSATYLLPGIYKIAKNEGVLGLYRGTTITVCQIYPLVGLNFLFYKWMNHGVSVLLEQYHGRHERFIPNTILFVNGAVAGLLAKVIVYPADLLHKRLQIGNGIEHRKSFGKNPKCKTLKECVVTTFRNEGWTGFYKGIVPTLIKASVSSAVYFTVYDHFVRKWIRPIILRERQEQG